MPTRTQREADTPTKEEIKDTREVKEATIRTEVLLRERPTKEMGGKILEQSQDMEVKKEQWPGDQVAAMGRSTSTPTSS
jgi:hypothetical protein